MAGISLIAGLGNPGPGYAATRHNAGFWFLDALAGRWPLELRYDNRFHGALADIRISGQRLRVLKPDTFMNRSGAAVATVARYFDLDPLEVLVVHDDLDLAPGSVRLKTGGGHGGHNGLRDIFSHLSTREFARLRLGIGHPGNADEVTDYVLQKPSAIDHAAILDAVDRAVAVLEQIVAGDFEAAMNELHASLDGNPT